MLGKFIKIIGIVVFLTIILAASPLSVSAQPVDMEGGGSHTFPCHENDSNPVSCMMPDCPLSQSNTVSLNLPCTQSGFSKDCQLFLAPESEIASDSPGQEKPSQKSHLVFNTKPPKTKYRCRSSLNSEEPLLS